MHPLPSNAILKATALKLIVIDASLSGSVAQSFTVYLSTDRYIALVKDCHPLVSV